jgi:hypothetical protein
MRTMPMTLTKFTHLNPMLSIMTAFTALCAGTEAP